ncbi:MAG: pantoate--beta-alanine ligase [Elusimicrobia bacterium]|nr:pantoate--beta-alanine ligase [Elusimicrobiota bacterium]
MRIVRDPAEMARLTERWRGRGERLGFVPTMGALHAGHASLIRRARASDRRVAVSIFVNPTQFGPKEDLSRYPRPFAADARLCRKEGVDALFHPAPAAMYPPGSSTFVVVEGLSDVLCGANRPGHFRGVATVVLKLFNIVRPDDAYFGEKDYQQLVVIRRMVRDLDLPVRIVGCPIVREPDGLAMSSRNAYLRPSHRALAPLIHAGLSAAARGGRSAGGVVAMARRRLAAIPEAELDYAALVDPDTLAPARTVRPGLRLLAAVRIGRTRLIDNVIIS